MLYYTTACWGYLNPPHSQKKNGHFSAGFNPIRLPIEPEAELLPEGVYFIIFNFKHVHRPILTKTIYFK
jgi:hypothetical protein